MTASWKAWLALVGALAITPGASGCAWFATASARHVGDTSCNPNIGFAAADMVLGSVSLAALVATETVDDSAAWLAVPGIYFASGVIGTIFVVKCRNRIAAAEVPGAMLGPAYPVELPPQRVETNAEPRDPSVDSRQVGLPRLSEDSPLGETPAPPATGGPLECGPALPTECPQGQVCQLHTGSFGTCVPELPKQPDATLQP